MDGDDAIDLVDPPPGIAVLLVAGSGPIVSYMADITALIRPWISRRLSPNLRVSPEPTGFGSAAGCGK